MRDRRSALMWTVAWWVARRYLRRRAAMTVAGIVAGATPRRSRLWGVLGAIGLVGALAGGFVVWRRLAGPADDDWASLDGTAPSTDAPVPTAAA